jgi:serine/threonine-protein kinase
MFGGGGMNAGTADIEEIARARIGRILRGKYCLERVLGIGGMSVVYAATHRNQARFAIKILHDDLALRADVRTRFLREGYAANSVNHPAIARVVDDDTTEDGGAFLVMELLEGCGVEPLWERYDRHMPVPAALAIAEQVLDGLAAAHACSIVHRDVKPANLFVTRDGSVKILDFGIARVRDAAASGMNGATGDGVLLGTPAFMAPEQAMGRTSDVDARTDVWSVGATLFALVSGRAVHQAESQSELLLRAATEQGISLRAVMPKAPAALAHVVDRALAFERDARWPSAKAMRDAVRFAYREAFGRRVGTVALLKGALEEATQDDAPDSEERTLREAMGAHTVDESGHDPVRTAPLEPAAHAPGAPGGLRTLPMADRPRRPEERGALGTTTAPPVSSDPLHAPPRSSIPSRMPRRWRAAAAAVVPVAILGLLVSAFRFGGRDEPPAAATRPPPLASAAPMAAGDASAPDAH